MSLQHKTFAHHTPSTDGITKIRDLRKAFDDLQSLIEGLAPASRERSVALTHLETTAMWTIKAVVVNDPGSKVEDV